MTDQTTTTDTTATDTTATTTAADATATTAQPTLTTAADTTTTTTADTTTTTPVATVWGDDWRVKLAGEDKAYLKQLEKFSDPTMLAKSYRELQAKLSSGDYKKAAPGKDATPEEIAAWRKETGVPEKVEDYKITPPQGVVFGDADKPLLDSFAQHAHANGWNNDQLNQAIAWYGKFQEETLAAQADKDDQFKSEAMDKLREIWPGQEFYRNTNAAKSLVQQLPKDFQDIFASARTTDGRILGDHPTILATMAQLAREINPAASVVPATVADPMRAIGDELKELETKMRDKSSDYWRGPKANDMQARYRELIDAKDKMGRRAA